MSATQKSPGIALALRQRWQNPEFALLVMAAAMPLSFSTWMTLLNNFAVERAGFGGDEIGWLQSLREVPGFIAFSAIWLLLLMRERSLALGSLAVLGLGVAATGLFPHLWGLLATTFVMSLGFHYFETMHMSLTLQWIPAKDAPQAMGRQIAVRSFASLGTYGVVWLLWSVLGLDYVWIYAMGGGATFLLALVLFRCAPAPKAAGDQHRNMVVRSRYWLFYALTFMGGARRQIFVVFAGFLLVTRFDFDVATVTALHLANHAVSLWFAPRIGRFVGHFGERKALQLEYIGLIAVFSGYALVDQAWLAAVLYIVDHVFFAFAIAQKSYLQKIADPRDIAATSGVSFSINHVAAVIIPATFGTYLWSRSPDLVFWAGAIMASISLLLAQMVPTCPSPGREFRWSTARAS